MSCNAGAEGAWREGRGEFWTTLGAWREGRGECCATPGCVARLAEVVAVDSGILTSASLFGGFFFFLQHTTQQTPVMRTATLTIMTITTAEGLEPEEK